MLIYKNIIKHNRFLKVKFLKLFFSLSRKERIFRKNLINYFEEYVSFYNFEPNQISDIYMKFIQNYIENIKIFKTDKSYNNLNRDIFFEKKEYDLIMLLSFIFDYERLKLLILFSETDFSGNTLFIGSGSGIELQIYLSKYQNIEYVFLLEKEESPFLKYYFEKKIIYIGLTDIENYKYHSVIAIEVIEHIKNYKNFIKKIISNIDINGIFFLTLAKNIPQFDHFINFVDYSELLNIFYEREFIIKKNVLVSYCNYTDIDSSNQVLEFKKSKMNS
ncbi:MAG: class I SAM-dependent methyltransferase [Novosphingobium sp.]|nr:class I SAM-dependent methyltransferase [Novosphingobium sp.]